MATKKSVKRKLTKKIEDVSGFQNVVPGRIGASSTLIDTGIPGLIYVRIEGSGQVVTAVNSIVPSEYNHPVLLARSKANKKLWEVVASRQAYSVPVNRDLRYHHTQHEYPNPDTVWVKDAQFLPFLVLPDTTFTVQIFGGVVNLSGIRRQVDNQSLDLASLVPASGAIWILIQVTSAGAIGTVSSSAVDSKELLLTTNIPIPSAGAMEICAVRLYAGQEQLQRDSINDFVDLRFGRDGASGIIDFPGSTEKLTVHLDDEVYGADSQAYHAATRWTWNTIKSWITAFADLLYAPIAKGVTNGDSHDHSGGDGAQIAFSTLSGLPTAVTNANDIWRCDNCGGSAFVGTIATLPGGADLTYNITSGNENAMVPVSTSQLAKMRLYNTTRSTSALISNCVIGTNTITLTANVPAGWQVGDTITIASQTVSGGSFDWVDLEITSGELLGKSSVFLVLVVYDSAVAFQTLRAHPFETYSDAKLVLDATSYSTSAGTTEQGLYKLNSNVITAAWSASGAATALVIIREAGYLL